MTFIVRRNPSRALTLVEPFYRPLSFLDGFERLARDVFESTSYTELTPRLDVIEDKDELVIKAEFPGIRKEDLDVSLEENTLTIKAEKKQEEVSEEATYYTCERCFGHYSRSISLPFPVDSDKLSSTFENGLLEIRLPKAEEAKPKRIEVKVGSPRLKRPKVSIAKSK